MPDALPATQLTVSNHGRKLNALMAMDSSLSLPLHWLSNENKLLKRQNSNHGDYNDIMFAFNITLIIRTIKSNTDQVRYSIFESGTPS